MRHATILVAIVAFVPLASATAQEPPPVKVGDRVRVTAPDLGIHKQEGRFVVIHADTLVVAVADSTMTFPVASVTRLEVGPKSRVALGAGIGLWGGGLLGYVISSGRLGGGCRSTVGEGSFAPATGVTLTRESCIWVSTVGGAVVGTLLGLVVGEVASTDKWRTVPLVHVTPRRDGRFGLGLSVRF